MQIKFLVLPLAALLLSCSKDRIEETKTDSFSSLDEFYDENKVEEQEFIINNEDSTGHITGNQGSEIYGGRSLFMFSNRADEVTFPYKIKLIELYKYDDIIFYQMPTPHSDGILNSGGEIRVRAFKDDEELVLKPTLHYIANFSSTATESDMKVFYGNLNGEKFSDWSMAADASSVAVTSGKYVASIYKMGWVTPAKNRTGNKADITFTIDGSGGENIGLAIVFKDFHGVITGKNLKLTDVPVGESATIVAMAKDQDGNYRLHQQDITITGATTIKLDMKTVTKEALLSALDKL